MIIAEDWPHFYDLFEHGALVDGTHAEVTGKLYRVQMEGTKHLNDGRGWYRSKERVTGFSPYAGYVANKKWHLIEVEKNDK